MAPRTDGFVGRKPALNNLERDKQGPQNGVDIREVRGRQEDLETLNGPNFKPVPEKREYLAGRVEPGGNHMAVQRFPSGDRNRDDVSKSSKRLSWLWDHRIEKK